jgi:glycosyltransferase involved in cell wall biosynthesis
MSLPKGSKILIVCDAIDENLLPPKPKWGEPLTNGVSNLVRHSIKELESDYQFYIIHPYMKENNQYIFNRFPLPRYKQFELAFPTPTKIWKQIKQFQPDAIIITTVEATLGRASKLLCHYPGSRLTKNCKKIPYTLTYTTNIDQYLSLYIQHHTNGMVNISSSIFNPIFKRFYSGAYKVLAPTLAPTAKTQHKLHQMGISNTSILPRGVDTTVFRPRNKKDSNPYSKYKWYKKNPLPIYLYFGRISLVKGIEDFLSLETPKVYRVVIGEGPYLNSLQKKFHRRDIHFLGAFYNEELANHIRFADLVFFPSKTDTWAQTITEAGACGIPVIAYDVPGSGEVVIPNKTGVLINPTKLLSNGINEALQIDKNECASIVKNCYSWKTTAQALIDNVNIIQWN